MTIVTHLSAERPGEPEITAIENSLGSSLPEDYKLFLKRDNGGRPRQRLFRMVTRNGGTEEGVIDYFFALHSGRIGSLKRAMDSSRGKLPDGHLPVATDSFGNLIVLKLAGPNPGQVYFWDHEEDGSGATAAELSRIAGSFTEFVGRLTVETP